MYRKNRIKATVALAIVIAFIMPATAFANNTVEKQLVTGNNNVSLNSYGDIINITVEETWIFANDTSNGIQIPVDVRSDNEWKNQHIDTPQPENPRHYCLDFFYDNDTLEQFLSLYSGKAVILYCKGGYRSYKAALILVENDFTGTIYSMIGGMNAWNAAGLPTKADQPPTVEIINPKEGYLHLSGIPIFPTILNVLADTVSIGGFRLQPIIINATDDYDDKADLMVKIYLNDVERNVTYNDDRELYEWKWTGFAVGTFNLTVTATDAYDGNISIEMEIWNFCIIP